MALYEGWYYNGCIRKMTIAFGSLFTNIYVARKNADGSTIEREIVPITFSAKEKFMQRIMQDPDLDVKTAVKLPHLAFDIVNYAYDPERKFSTKRKIADQDSNDPTKYKYFYTPVPYNVDFELYLMTKTQDEGLQVIEQILPFFTPDYNLTVRLSDLANYKQDMPVSLSSVHFQDTYEGNYDQRRTLIWTLSFRMKGYILGPERNVGRILHTKVNVNINGTSTTVQPLSNTSVAIPTTTTFGIVNGIDGSILDLTSIVNQDKTLLMDVPRNQKFDFTIEVSDGNNTLVNLTGYNIYATFRKNFSHPAVYNISTHLGSAAGTIECEIPADVTSPLENGLYIGDVSIENSQTLVVTRVAEFILNVK